MTMLTAREAPTSLSLPDRVWTVFAGVLIGLGLIGALGTPGPLPAVALFMTAATLGVVLVLSVVCVMDPDGPIVRVTAWGGLCTGTAVVTLAGWVNLLGAATLLVLMVLPLTCPALWSVVRRARRGARPAPAPAARVQAPPPQAPVDADVPFVVPDAMEDTDLCLAWCSSFVALQRARTTESRLRAVEIRAIYLDALERRDPSAFTAWLASGARAAARPRTFRAGH